ncbi:phosphomethylpyrimidine kinase [Acidimicrobium ferrooxidans DSM 10331]|uniref:Phosphomethylpyrimidine kinase n=1 Tax=Acidimicrobium ferrooxidans (strain DSM 10331 / JCM 15462 / NBRC 103882 / ICP) TaxID=525909 RepID=C7LZD0_ACIFD|nr:bifunctional hydroxymethylpyrimidine kinase/phosphomethylpyrimidine kinase [Acidimicrobium ferrooxidans]ACU54088.1 phosphomethylpyrimidine kinase [Acidimicrobium ferrooxidans DSM 10331]
MTPTPAVALTIAGSDSGGGAGIQADLVTFAAFEVHGTSAITAVTAQNTVGVSAVVTIDPDVIEAQVRSVTDDFMVRATKTGMLATAPIVERVAALAASGILGPLVVDPVMVSTTGATLLDADAVQAVRDALLPSAALVTPNRAEAELLTGIAITSIEAQRAAAQRLVELGARAALVKGGHLDGPDAIDILFDGRNVVELRAPRVWTRNDHGTGCTLSAAICACLARGLTLPRAVEEAKAYVTRGLADGADWGLGTGRGPFSHFAKGRPAVVA